ncbi:importin alpha [Anaeramoeba flamelloides]|uniref:Importin subunit alpha n=1 Tax=Anaeramoeba flamelloides TaxID=1746091 RepID=A0AAV7Z387_9EUKA|nr:importin alpha [Anaeramoeba flamelloides]
MSDFQNKLRRREKKFKQKQSIGNSVLKRAEITVKFSKNKRKENLTKKRNLGKLVEQDSSNSNKMPLSTNNLNSSIKLINSNDKKSIRNGTEEIRKLLSVEEQPPNSLVISSGIVPKFISFLKGNDQKLIFESLWILSNLCSGSHEECKRIVDLDAISHIFNHLSSKDPNIIEQSVWAFGNIAGDCSQYRDMILNHPNSLKKLINLFNIYQNNLEIIKIICWVKCTLPIFVSLLNAEDQVLLIDALYALSYLSDGESIKIQSVIETGCTFRLIELLQSTSIEILAPTLEIFGNLVSGDHSTTEKIISVGILEALKKLIHHSHAEIKKNVCWILSNITAGTPPQIEKVIQNGYIPPVIQLLAQDQRMDIRNEACWIISNAIYCGTAEQISKMVSLGALKEILNFLKKTTLPRMKIISLTSISKILKIGENEAQNSKSYNHYIQLVEQKGGVKTIEKLSNHENNEIRQLSDKILDNYLKNFDEKSEDLDIIDQDDFVEILSSEDSLPIEEPNFFCEY